MLDHLLIKIEKHRELLGAFLNEEDLDLIIKLKEAKKNNFDDYRYAHQISGFDRIENEIDTYFKQYESIWKNLSEFQHKIKLYPTVNNEIVKADAAAILDRIMRLEANITKSADYYEEIKSTWSEMKKWCVKLPEHWLRENIMGISSLIQDYEDSELSVAVLEKIQDNKLIKDLTMITHINQIKLDELLAFDLDESDKIILNNFIQLFFDHAKLDLSLSAELILKQLLTSDDEKKLVLSRELVKTPATSNIDHLIKLILEENNNEIRENYIAHLIKYPLNELIDRLEHLKFMLTDNRFLMKFKEVDHNIINHVYEDLKSKLNLVEKIELVRYLFNLGLHDIITPFLNNLIREDGDWINPILLVGKLRFLHREESNELLKTLLTIEKIPVNTAFEFLGDEESTELLSFLPPLMNFDIDANFSKFYHLERRVDEITREKLVDLVNKSDSVRFKRYLELSGMMHGRLSFLKKSSKRELEQILEEEGLT